MNVKKSELVKRVADQTGFSHRDTARIVNLFFKEVAQELKTGNSVCIFGFGNFKSRTRAARMGRNPLTGEALEIKASRAVSFNTSYSLRKILNS